MAESEGCRDERRGSSASEVGTDDGTENNNNNNNNKTLVEEDLNKFPKNSLKMSL